MTKAATAPERSFSDSPSSTVEDRYAVNVIDLPGGIKKTLVLREIPQDGIKKLLYNKESLASCDIVVFVHDSSDEFSWRRATELLVEVAGHGEDTGYEVPCLIVAAKDDLNSFPMAIQESTRKFLAASLVWEHICQQKRYSSDYCRMLPARTLFSDWR
ncbi:mitochondrial Rho GTPase 1-like [Euphorbia lathyris]|uniref:mitochondrial Rho GTPase 1-like n=1 Tax=Euphorbia lathyris TaxID=212925 RepID=UPI003313F4CF